MTYIKLFTALLLLLPLTSNAGGQDLRSNETKVADLLSRFPTGYKETTDALMSEMLQLGEPCLRQICGQVMPAGSGDDTRARFAVESMSRFLSQKGKENERSNWENICLSYLKGESDYTIMDFFMKQLQLAGSDLSAEAVKGFLTDKNLCTPAVAVLSEIGSPLSEKILSESLITTGLPCASSVLNSLADMKSDLAINEFIKWTASPDVSIKRAAFRALSRTGSPTAYKILSSAAKKADYRWEHSGSVESLLDFAIACGEKGNIALMERTCKALIENCRERINIQYKTGALHTLVTFKKEDALPYIITALSDKDKTYRVAALEFSKALEGPQVSRAIMKSYSSSDALAKPEIIYALGERKDSVVTETIISALTDQDVNVRIEAAYAIVKLKGKGSVPSLVSYLNAYPERADQDAAKEALKRVLDNDNIPVILPLLDSAPSEAITTVVELLEWKGRKEDFQSVYKLTSSSDQKVKDASIKALKALCSPADQAQLLSLLEKTADPLQLAALQDAIAKAAIQDKQAGDPSSLLLKSLSNPLLKIKIIPILSMVGGSEALSAVLAEFEQGSTEIRSICFNSLCTWSDFSASKALYEICASKNKTYESKAFEAYIRLLKTASVTEDQKLLLYRKIMPFALDYERKATILEELRNIKTYPSFFFTAGYLDDNQVSAVAAKSLLYIALPSGDTRKGLQGELIREGLAKASARLKGTESDYDREMVSRYLLSMSPDPGFLPLFNGKDLSGWKGLVENPRARSEMKAGELSKRQAAADLKMLENWSVKDGCIWFSGSGDNLCTVKDYSDFELYVDWKITKKGDSGIYLRGSPQVQIWDTSRVDAGAQVGSGGLYNNQKNESKPARVADNAVGDWNTFRIRMIGERVSVWLNGILVVDEVIFENYWERALPVYTKGPIELQAHGNELAFRDIYVKEINEIQYNLSIQEKDEGFVSLFNGRNLDGWTGDKKAYVVEDEMIVIKPEKGSGGNLYTEKEYADFNFRFEFCLTPGANNGLGIRAPLEGDAAYVGMELQILDDTAPVYSKLEPYQYHGSIYGVVPSKRGYLKSAGEWNSEEVIVKGSNVKVILNGTVIVDADISLPAEKGTMDRRNHPGLKNTKGHIGFLGHGSVVRFRNIRIKGL